jgi:diaminopimelate decarboxylase
VNDREAPRHAPLAGFGVADGRLVIGGVAVDRLAARVGQTPFFAYDRSLLDARVAELRRVLPGGVHLHYAIKANPMPALVQHMAGLVDGFDVASGLELRTALDTPMAPHLVSFAGPGKTRAEIDQAVAAGAIVSAESENELAAIAEAGRALGVAPRVMIRVNPDFELKSSGMRMGGGPKQFGIDAERVPQALSSLPRLGLAFEGLHIFAGSQNLRAESLIETQAKTIDLAIALAAHAPSALRLLNMGGGFGIPYFPGERRLDLAPVGAALAEVLPRLKAAQPEVQPVIELGRYLVGEAGVYVCRVLDRKDSRGQVFLITDGGLHHQLAASGNFGQVIRKNYPVAVASRMDAAPAETVNVVGCLCTPLDLLGDRVALPRAEIGDLIAVFQSGAYGPSASPTAFLSHPAPVEVLV